MNKTTVLVEKKGNKLIINYSDGNKATHDIENNLIGIDVLRKLEVAQFHGSQIKVKGWV